MTRPAVALLDQPDVADAFSAVDLRSMSSSPIKRLAGARLERVQVDVPAPQTHTVAVEVGDAGGVDEDAAVLAAGDEPDDPWWMSAAHAAGNDDDVLDLADLRSAGVEQRADASL